MALSDWLRALGRGGRESAPVASPLEPLTVPAFREEEVPSDVPRVCIVTPVFNGADYIDETIHSVLSQAGDFVLHYHVQDGGSTDDTMARVEHWRRLSETLPRMCRQLIFTCVSERDEGMYDAINRAFARALPPGDDVVMGWINADDRVAPGALSAITSIRATYPDVRFLGGRISLIDQAGAILGVHGLIAFSQRCMRAGLYDGRARNFIMQEGTFWCSDLWTKVGGLDTHFRLAGDWDFWRRLADHAPYVSADTILGFHRRRPGQLSEQMDRYYAEVDAKLDEIDDTAPAGAVPCTRRETYADVSLEHERIVRNPSRFRQSGHAASAVRYNLDARRWDRTDGLGLVAGAPDLVTPAGTTESIVVRPTGGCRAPEGPYPEHGLLAQVRWMDGRRATGEVAVAHPGRFRVALRCRSWTFGQSVALLVDGQPLARLAVTPHEHDRDLLLSSETTLDAGRHELEIELHQPAHDRRFLLLIDWWIERLTDEDHASARPVSMRPTGLASRTGPPPIGAWPGISLVLVTHDQGHLLRDALNAIVRQGYSALELIVVDRGSSDQTPLILREFRPYIAHLIVAHDGDEEGAIERGLRATTGNVLGWLRADQLLTDDALHAVGHAFLTSDGDVVSGVCEVLDESGTVLRRTVAHEAGDRARAGSFFARTLRERERWQTARWKTIRAPLIRCREDGALAGGFTDPLPPATLEVDTELFAGGDRWRARSLLELPQDAFIVLVAQPSSPGTLAQMSAAHERLAASGDVVLLVPASACEPGELPANTRYLGDLGSDALTALFLQAADVIVDLGCDEASGRWVLRAGACEVPGVALAEAGAAGLILDGITGLLAGDAVPLGDALETLRGDPGLRRRLGLHARLHAVNGFGASAIVPASESLASARWRPLRGLVREAEGAHARKDVWQVDASSCALLLPAVVDGLHTLQLTVRPASPDERVALSINDGERQGLTLAGSSAGEMQVLQFGVALVAGWNRTVIEAAAGMRVEELSWWQGLPRAEGSVDMLESFGPLEGPYPEHGLPRPIRWALGHRCQLRIFARSAGRRALELRVRNDRPDQTLAVWVNDVRVASFDLDHPSLTSLRELSFDADLRGGPNVVRIEATRVLDSQDDPRPIAFIYDDLLLADLPTGDDDAPVLVHRCSAGFAAMTDDWEEAIG